MALETLDRKESHINAEGQITISLLKRGHEQYKVVVYNSEFIRSGDNTKIYPFSKEFTNLDEAETVFNQQFAAYESQIAEFEKIRVTSGRQQAWAV